MDSSKQHRSLVIGWREWASLPQLGIAHVKAKIDTGARSSCLHAFDVETFQKKGEKYVRFKVHPLQRNTRRTVSSEAPVLEFRKVRSSSGHSTLRPVIVTEIELLGRSWEIELTLANRDEMGFRMLLGREAVRSRFLVDAGRSYFGGKVKPKTTTKKKRKPKTRRTRPKTKRPGSAP